MEVINVDTSSDESTSEETSIDEKRDLHIER
jgi:hypothetical protein